MTESSGDDAERLQAIARLQRAIAAKQPILRSARDDYERALSTQAACQSAINDIDRRIEAVGQEEHLRGDGVYLNGSVLDRGTLVLGNEVVRFSGWRGGITLLLADIEGIELGSSFLPPRAGIPILDTLWPGEPRPAETLLIKVRDGAAATGRLAVIANLAQASTWREQIQYRQRRLGDVAALRADLAGRQEKAQAAYEDAARAVEEARIPLDAVQGEVSSLQRQVDKLKDLQRQIDDARERAARAERDALRAREQDMKSKRKKGRIR